MTPLTGLRFLSALGAAAAIAIAIVHAPNASAQPSQHAGANLAYDEIVRFLTNATPPPPGSFGEDAARIAALPPMPDTKGVNSAIDTMNAIGSNPLLGLTGVSEFMIMAEIGAVNAYNSKVTAASEAYRKAGIMKHAWFSHGWSRVDANGRVVIVKPESGVQIILNPAKRSYSESRTAPAMDVATYTLDEAPSATQFTAAPTIQALPTMTLAGHRARGYQTDASFLLSTSLGFCSPGRHVLREIEYVADIGDPQTSSTAPVAPDQIAQQVCAPTDGGSRREPGHLVLFRSTDISGAAGHRTVIVLERGNLQPLGPSDAALFSVPPNYNKESSP